MRIDIVKPNRLSGMYKRGENVCWWSVWHNPMTHCWNAYTSGDSESPCDVGYWREEMSKSRAFETEHDALTYLAGIIPEVAA